MPASSLIRSRRSASNPALGCLTKSMVPLAASTSAGFGPATNSRRPPSRVEPGYSTLDGNEGFTPRNVPPRRPPQPERATAAPTSDGMGAALDQASC